MGMEDFTFGMDQPSETLAFGLDSVNPEPHPAQVPDMVEFNQVDSFTDSFLDDLPDPELTNHPALKPISPWPPALPVELAMGAEPLESILTRYNLTEANMELLYTLPSFRRAISEAETSLQKEGHTFKMKCGRIADEFLEEIYLGFFDKDRPVPLSAKHEIFKTVVRLAGLEPKEEKVAPQGNMQNIQININV